MADVAQGATYVVLDSSATRAGKSLMSRARGPGDGSFGGEDGICRALSVQCGTPRAFSCQGGQEPTYFYLTLRDEREPCSSASPT